MSDKEVLSTADICATLFFNLSQRGLAAPRINQLVKDVFNLVQKGGVFTIAFVNHELESLGWEPEMIDENTFEMILALLEKEFDFTITSHTVH